MIRRRTIALLWITLPVLWIGGGLAAHHAGADVHGRWAGAWMLAGIVAALALVGVTLWWLTGDRAPAGSAG